MARWRQPYLVWTALGTILLLSALVPLAYVVLPHVDRHLRLKELTSPDPAKRARALSYIIGHAADDPRVLTGAVARLVDADNANFLEIVAALDAAAAWDRDHVPVEDWLRWLTLLSESEEDSSRIAAVQLAAEAPDLADDPGIVGMLKTLIDDAQADVRFNALASAAELAGAAADASDYEQVIAAATDDDQPTIARHAWIILGWLDPGHGYEGNWRDAPPRVAEAILWATIKTNPSNPAPAIEALQHPDKRAAAAYALHLSDSPEAMEALLDIVDVEPSQLAESEIVPVWRAILGLPKPDATRKPYSRLENALAPFAEAPEPGSPLEPLALAAVYRFGIVGENSRAQDDPLSPLIRLATVEGQPGPEMEWPIVLGMPELLRVMTTAVTRTPSAEALRDALASQEPTLRDLVCVVLHDRLSNEQHGELVDELIEDYDDRRKMTGAILSGLTGRHPGHLRRQARKEDRWSVRQVMRLGLWMHDKLPELDDAIPGMLTRDDLPTTTVLLATLHRGGQWRVAALDFLLNPRGEPTVDLVDLFDQKRWWHVLKHYLPDDAPAFWVWADPDLEAFQIDLLRDWYLVNRYRMGQPDQEP